MAYVCSCRAVTDRTVTAAILAGAECVESVAAACGAGGRCGGCHPTIESLIDEATLGRRLRRESAA